MVTRTPPFDRLITAKGAAATLYASDGVSSPIALTLLVTNAAALRSVRSSSDVTTVTYLSTLSPAPVPGQILTVGGMWYVIIKSLRSVVTGMPGQATLAAFEFQLTGTRDTTPLTVRVLVRSDTQAMRTDGTLNEKLTLLCPLGATVLLGDVYTYNGFLYRVDGTSLASADGHAYGQELLCSMVGSAGGGPGVYPITNATISLKDGPPSGATVYSARRVNLTETIPVEVIGPGGATVKLLLFDEPGSTYALGDIVTITAVDGHTGVPSPNSYPVGEVALLSTGVPVVRVQLTGTDR